MDRVWESFCRESEIDPEIYIVFTKNKASWVELQRDLSVDDVFDLLEIIDIETTLEEAAHRDAELAQKRNKGR